ncbi:hypothetical protein V5E97_01170 [Singulisphaera sp. Ch08]|uniref:SMI1/KNR4 family protein n=1 Tax=Singulisphaera sp. Ch08 TaxID=3120278 RepID=A0AAU7CHW7_9BACT
MNESEWISGTHPWNMLRFLEPRANQRKLQLFAVACCRRASPLSNDPRHQELVEAAEQFAEGLLTADAFEQIRDTVAELPETNPENAPWGPSCYMTAATLHARGDGSAKFAASFAARGLASLAGEEDSPEWLAVLTAEETAQCDRLRDIFGSPFRPFRFPPAWLANEGRPARELAREIEAKIRHEQEDLAALADLLERAGCDDRSVINHCRTPGTHVRGCWVLDALLGRDSAVREGLTTEADWQSCGDPAPILHFLRGKGTERKWRLFAVACCRRIEHLITDERSRHAMEMAARSAEGAATKEEMEKARAIAQEVQDETFRAEYSVEAEENFCMTPRHAEFCRRSLVARAARSAVCRDPRTPDAELARDEAEAWRPSDEWAGGALRFHIYENMHEYNTSNWQAEVVKQAVHVVDTAERRAHSEILCDLFGELFGPPGINGAWLPIGEDKQEAWCTLPSALVFNFRREWLTWNRGALPNLARSIYEAEQFDRLPILADALETAGCTESAILNHLRGPGPHHRGCWVLDLLLGWGSHH